MMSSRTEQNCALYVEDGVIQDIGPTDTLQRRHGDVQVVDAGGRMVTPGLIDPHTHLVHAGSREDELTKKLAGVPYLDILKQGGGILATVKKTRAASLQSLIEQARTSLERMLLFGVTTAEAKSGYGLNRATELRQLEAVAELSRIQPVKLISTFLGAHAVPPEANTSDEFLENMLLLLHEVKQRNLAEFCDIFCEQGVFSVEQGRRLLTEAKRLGLGVKIHADEIEALGGARLAAELGAVSADHLLMASDDDLAALASRGVVAVVLPGTSWNLGKAPARTRAMVDLHKLAVAIATDYNPGSCPTENLQLIMAFAANLMRLQPMEVFAAVTRNAAFAIGRGDSLGMIAVGRKADLVLWNASNPAYVVYHFGVNHVHSVWIDGHRVVNDGSLCTRVGGVGA